MSPTEERLAKNESFFRQVNERIREIAGDNESTLHEFLCECADPGCTERVTLTVGEYEAVRAEPRRFVLLPGHKAAGVERIVDSGAGHLVVEKIGPAGAIAAELDPRDS